MTVINENELDKILAETEESVETVEQEVNAKIVSGPGANFTDQSETTTEETVAPKRKRRSKKEIEAEKQQEEESSDIAECESADRCEVAQKTWLDVFTENYNGKSELAKSVEEFLKSNYKGNIYLPWATMERITYMLDPNSEFKNIQNANGGLVHSDIIMMEQMSSTDGKVVSSSAPMMSHFVKVAVIFMEKVFIEDYPIQDNDYGALKIINQNAVNKALQRAKAKVAARATGIGLKLYEGHDLQFDTPEDKVTPSVNDVKNANTKKVETKTSKVSETKEEVVAPEPKVVQAVETPKIEPTKTEDTTPSVEITGVIKEAIDLIKNGEENAVNSILQRLNMSLVKTYHFGLSRTDSDSDLAEKISKFPDAEKFISSLKKMGL